MGSLGMEVVKRRKAMWLYPKIAGFNPPERWGHSACFFEGVMYAFGGCCGGLHFSDVAALNLETMTWTSLVTTGQKPGSRDSHSTALVGQKMVVLGGTNGTKKVNDLHILDLRTREWSKPNYKGTPPSPRESHTATLVGDDKLLIFGGSGEGEANYLNDVYVLDLKSMTWISPEVKGEPPAPRDSHTATAIGDKLLIYGGDCGDRYHGEVDVLDTQTMTWSRLEVKGSSPGVRAGHAAVNIGTKVYIIGGVGDKQYYSDVWILDFSSCSWAQLDIRGQQPQGRFSHTAVVANSDIAVYGGCGEDERPLNELIILQLGSEHPNGRYNMSMCKIFGNHWIQEKRRFLRTEGLNTAVLKNAEQRQRSKDEVEPRNSVSCGIDKIHVKRRKITDPRVLDIESEQEEHSLSLSQHSSPSQSDQDQNVAQKLSAAAANYSILAPQQFSHMKPFNQRDPAKTIDRNTPDTHFLGGESPRRPKTEQFLRSTQPQRPEGAVLGVEQKPQIRPLFSPMIGAEVHGTVDGAFDSGFLMTANVNGQIFRGVLFAPAPVVAAPRAAIAPQGLTCSSPIYQHSTPHAIPIHVRPPPRQPMPCSLPECGQGVKQTQQMQVLKAQPAKFKSELQDVVLTLGGPGGGGVS